MLVSSARMFMGRQMLRGGFSRSVAARGVSASRDAASSHRADLLHLRDEVAEQVLDAVA
jgi:hypothetical protein